MVTFDVRICVTDKDNQYKLNKAMATALANFACKILHRIFSLQIARKNVSLKALYCRVPGKRGLH